MKRARNAFNVLGEGTYNVTILINDMVWRFGRLRNGDDTTLASFRRSEGIVNLLNTENPNPFGPSLLKVPSNGEIKKFRELGDEIKIALRNTKLYADLSSQNEEVFVQHMEYLDGGEVDKGNIKTNDDLKILFLSLTWMLYTTGAYYGFRHRDLKGDNIVYRVNDTPVIYQFTVNGYGSFQFETNRIPVLIDFDFASIFVTNRHDSRPLGTYELAPPEAIISQIEALMLDIDDMGVECPSYDYYSVAMTCVYAVIRFGTFRHFFNKMRQERKDFYALIITLIQNRNKRETGFADDELIPVLIDALFFNFFVTLHLNDGVFIDEKDPYQFLAEFLKVIPKPDPTLKKLCKEKITAFPILKDCVLLLDIDPQHRMDVTAPYKLFKTFMKPVIWPADQVYTCDKLPLFTMGSADTGPEQMFRVQQIKKMNKALKEYHYLASSITCQSCGKDANFIDSLHGLFYCSHACHSSSFNL